MIADTSQMSLAAVRGRPGLNNHELSQIIGLSDRSQISRLMQRLQTHGLVVNSQAHTNRHTKAWRLTMAGEAALDAHRGARHLIRVQRKAAKGAKRATPRRATSRRAIPRPGPRRHTNDRPAALAAPATTTFHMTPLTHQVLSAIASLSAGETYPSNRQIALAADGRDEGHISKLLRHLEHHGLVQNSGPATAGAPKAWRLTSGGEHLLSESPVPTK